MSELLPYLCTAVLTTLCENASTGLRWLDLESPSAEEIAGVAQRYGLPETVVQDSLDPHHLPKAEVLEGGIFVLLRAHDESLQGGAPTTSVQEFTRKLAVFVLGNTVLTLHRAQMPYLTHAAEQWNAHQSAKLTKPSLLLLRLIEATLHTFEAPLQQAEERMDRFEFDIFHNPRSYFNFHDFYQFRRNLGVIKKVLRMTTDILARLDPKYFTPPVTPSDVQDARETLEALLYQAESLALDGNQLMEISLQLADRRTNEIIRVLTIFSVFFMPITFIVGIYGMNFHFMPELSWRYGYLACWVFMLGVTIAIWIWFKRKHWM